MRSKDCRYGCVWVKVRHEYTGWLDGGQVARWMFLHDNACSHHCNLRTYEARCTIKEAEAIDFLVHEEGSFR